MLVGKKLQSMLSAVAYASEESPWAGDDNLDILYFHMRHVQARKLIKNEQNWKIKA